METMSVEGRNYTSNTARLLKHLDKLQGMQRGIVSPVMVHIATNNSCNLTCSFCCYGNRELKQSLTLEQVKLAVAQFRMLGTLGCEHTGGGEPTLWPHLNEAVEYEKSLGYDVGLITNGINTSRFDLWNKLHWVRVSLHGFDFGKEAKIEATVKLIRSVAPNTTISSVYIWTNTSPQNFDKVVQFTNRHEIPTRVTPDLTVGNVNIDTMMKVVGGAIERSGGKYVFLSDFNVKTERAHHHCYMHMVKPFVFPDGNVYVCPSAALSPENNTNVNDQFKVCSIEGIWETYGKGVTVREHPCQFCKYAGANELIHEVLRPVNHHAFA